ncbi:MAG: SRPBCC family protein [Solirubrobacteraceae bacterium]
MSTRSTVVPVHASIVVDAPIDRAFDVFTADMGSWWPESNHILQGELAEMVFEPRVGGSVYDRAVDGSVCRWARVLAYEPPDRVVFSWDITLEWAIESDPERCSEVEIQFIAETPTRTRVELAHRGLERHGDGWESMRAAVDSDGGWRGGLEAFARRLAG